MEPFGITLDEEECPTMFHPNINHAGQICNKGLKNQNVAMTARERINAVCHMLKIPNGSDPLDMIAGKIFNDNERKFRVIAKAVFNKTITRSEIEY